MQVTFIGWTEKVQPRRSLSFITQLWSLSQKPAFVNFGWCSFLSAFCAHSAAFSPPYFKTQSKLEEALSLATEFQNSLQDFINWLTLAEQSLNVAPPPSLMFNTVLSQIEDHKVMMPTWVCMCASEGGWGELSDLNSEAAKR